MKRTLLLLLLLCLCPLSAALADTPTVALFYGPNAPLDELKAFDIVVVDPDHGDDPVRYRKSYSELYAYVGVGEAHPSRTWFKDIPGTARLADNRDWGSLILDLSPEDRQAAMFGLYYLMRDVVVSVAAFGGALLWMISPVVNFWTASLFGLAGTVWFALKGRDVAR